VNGYEIALGPCWACHRLFTFDPDTVPSIHGAPLCRDCVERANELRVAAGVAPIVIYPTSYPDADQ
jgi:hypothetical protein